ncbi:MAG: hypothetical protein KBF74_02675 [Ferruginibacter sp.]|nr:hypothetical protein [Ferruginibacter sp.]
MIFKKDSITLGFILGLIAPILGIILFKIYKFGIFTYRETYDFMRLEPGHKTLSVALTLSLLLNALLFTIYINSAKDNTAKGIFISTVLYGMVVLLIKTFG